MAVTQAELDNFHRFASGMLGNGGADSVEDCLALWRARQEEAETVASIERSVDDIAAGRFQSLEEVDAELRTEFGFPARNR